MAITKIDYSSAEKQKALNEGLYGKTIYIIGTSEYGATNTPTLIRSEAQLTKCFGKQGSLISGYKEVKKGHPDNQVFLCKTTGTHSILHLDVNIKDSGIAKDGFIIKAKDSNQIYNNIKVNINEESLVFIFPKELGGGIKEYLYSDYEILGLLAKKINEDTANGKNFLYAQCIANPSTPAKGSLNVTNPTEMYLYGGDSGLLYCKNLYYNCLDTTYELLEGADIDVIVPLEAFADDVLPGPSMYNTKAYNSLFYQEDKDYLNLNYIDGRRCSYYEQLLVYCVKQMRFGMVTHGVIGFNRTPDKYLYNDSTTYLHEVVECAMKLNFTNPELTSYQFLVSMVIGDVTYEYGAEVNNAYTFYAGLLSSLTVATSTTNKPLDKSVYIYNEFNKEELSYLSDLGIVAFRESPLNDKAVVSSGVTPASISSSFHNVCNVRMVQLAVSYIREQFQDYLGEDIHYLLSSGIAQDNIDNLLGYLKDIGVITGFQVQLIKNDDIGALTYYVDLKTVYMVEFTRVTGGITYKVR